MTNGSELTIKGETRLYADSNFGSATAAAKAPYRFIVEDSTLNTTNAYWAYRSNDGETRIVNSTWNAPGNGTGSSNAIGIGRWGDDYAYLTTQRLVVVNSTITSGIQHNVGNFTIGSFYNDHRHCDAFAYVTNSTITVKGQFVFSGCGSSVIKGSRVNGIGTENYGLVVDGGHTLTVEDTTFSSEPIRLSTSQYAPHGPRLIIGEGAVFTNIFGKSCNLGMTDRTTEWTKTNEVHQLGGFYGSRFMTLAYKAEPSHYILKGGVYSSYTTAGGSGARNKAPTKFGWAHFTADGGTVKCLYRETYQYERPIFERLDRLDCGEGGLNIDTCAINHLVSNDVTNVEGVRGRFTKRGTGSLRVHIPSKWDVAETVVKESSLIVRPNNTLSPSAAMETAMIVEPAATLSTSGGITELTLDSLAVTNGTLRIDPGDVIRVKNALALSGLKVEFVSAPTAETDWNFLAFDGELSAEQQRMLRLATFTGPDGMIPDGKSTFVDFIPDGQGGTTVKMKITTAPAVSGTATWTGPGDQWKTASNWSSAAVPLASDTATFTGRGDGGGRERRRSPLVRGRCLHPRRRGHAEFHRVRQLAARVAEGTLDLSAAGTVTNACFGGGAGTISGGTFQNARIRWDGESVPRFSNCTFLGSITVDLGRTEENPLLPPLPQNTAVASFVAGAVPPVSQFRVEKTSAGTGRIYGTFTSAAGTVSMALTNSRGTIIFVR